jgi:hypothetical protein
MPPPVPQVIFGGGALRRLQRVEHTSVVAGLTGLEAEFSAGFGEEIFK